MIIEFFVIFEGMGDRPKAEDNLVVSEVCVVVHREDGIRFYVSVGQESIVERIPLRTDHMNGCPQLRPPQVG